MMWLLIIISATLFLAYANGVNDNFKGVATLFGSKTANYKTALIWATISTLGGSITAAFFATKLAKVFSGKGLLPDALISSPEFLVAVMLGAGLTVFFASRAGIPISTTHSLTGALVGCGLVAVGMELNFQALGANFFYPLALSPLISMALAGIFYLLLTNMRQTLGITKESCLCIGEKRIALTTGTPGESSAHTFSSFDVILDDREKCRQKSIEVYNCKLLGFGLQKVLDSLHFLSAGAVGFARGLNDTPKIIAIAMAAGALNLQWLTFAAAFAMALGGILQAKKVAFTMSRDITSMNHGQGLTANLITSVLVIFASRWGMPVSTTHVSCGSLFGIGAVHGKADWNVIKSIILAWILTLPIAAGISALIYTIIQGNRF